MPKRCAMSAAISATAVRSCSGSPASVQANSKWLPVCVICGNPLLRAALEREVGASTDKQGTANETVERLLAARRVRRLRHADLARLHVPLKKVLPFVEAADYRPGRALDAADLAAQLTPPPVQRSLF